MSRFRLLARLLPRPMRSRLKSVKFASQGLPPIGRVEFGDLRRTEPVSRNFGYERGRPIDRFYIERFLEQNGSQIRGRVLEIGDDAYTRRFGGDRATIRDVLHVAAGNPQATFVADLVDAPQVPSDAFDTVIFTQTLHLIFDSAAALATLHRILRPGGVLLLTTPGITQVPHRVEWADTWYWSFTERAISGMLARDFGGVNVQTESFGNVLAATAFLQGLCDADLHEHELLTFDPDYPVIVCARATKGPDGR